MTLAETAEARQVFLSSVKRWKKAFQQGGESALTVKRPPGARTFECHRQSSPLAAPPTREALLQRAHPQHSRCADVVRYLRALHQQHGGPPIVVMDRLNVHRSAVNRLLRDGANWLTVEWLPPYAPDLNPVEALGVCQVLDSGQLRAR